MEVASIVVFYISIMFVGILLMTISLICMALDKKKYLEDQAMLEEKKDMLTSVISDAAEMIEELNNISDYLVSHINEKKQEVINTIKITDEKVKEIADKKIKSVADRKVKEIVDEKVKTIADERIKAITNKKIKAIADMKIKEVVDEKIKEIADERIKVIAGKRIMAIADKKIKAIADEKIEEIVDKFSTDDGNAIFRNMLSEDSFNQSFAKNKIENKKKIIPINGRYKEVIDLSQSGLDETQIAKKLNMGKGEIQLVLGINK